MSAVSVSCSGCRIRCCGAIHAGSRSSFRWRNWPAAGPDWRCARWKPHCGHSAPESSERRKPPPWPCCGSDAGAAEASSTDPEWSAGVSPPAGHLWRPLRDCNIFEEWFFLTVLKGTHTPKKRWKIVEFATILQRVFGWTGCVQIVSRKCSVR